MHVVTWRWRWVLFSAVLTPFFELRPVGRRVPGFSGVFFEPSRAPCTISTYGRVDICMTRLENLCPKTTTTTTQQQQPHNNNNHTTTTTTQQQQPTTNNQQPTTNNQQPTTNNQQPTTNNQQPTSNIQHPTTTTTTPLRGPATVSWWRGLVASRSDLLGD